MDGNRLPNKILKYKPKGRRNIGRPQTKWEDDFRVEGRGLSLIVDDNDDEILTGLT